MRFRLDRDAFGGKRKIIPLTPAKAGAQVFPAVRVQRSQAGPSWVPAFAGMSGVGRNACASLVALAASLMAPVATFAETPASPPAAEAPAASTPTAPDCSGPEFHQFDFWIGKWDVFDTRSGKPAGSSLIESLYGGCVLRENWSEPGFSGGSLNIYDRRTGTWRQTWTDSSGRISDYVGGLTNGRMILVWTYPSEKYPNTTIRTRMTFTPNPDGSVEQFSDESRDGGVSWTERYDYTYRKAAQPKG